MSKTAKRNRYLKKVKSRKQPVKVTLKCKLNIIGIIGSIIFCFIWLFMFFYFGSYSSL